VNPFKWTEGVKTSEIYKMLAQWVCCPRWFVCTMITCLHSVATTAEAIRQLEFFLPTNRWGDLAPVDYHVFELLHGWSLAQKKV